MKTYLLIPLLAVCLFSCKKEEPIKKKDRYDYYDGKIIVKRNSKNWKPKLLAVSGDAIKFGVEMDDYRDGFSWDKIGLGPIPLKPGTYEIIDQRVWDTTTNPAIKAMVAADYNGSFNQGSDVWGPNYLRTDRPRFITVSAYDSASKTVSGTFSLSFMRDSTYATLGIRLDTVSYTEGFFSATIHNPDELPR